MRERESSGLLALFPTSPEAVARGVFWRECGCSHQGVMAEEGAHCPAMMLHLLGESQCRTYQPSNASGSGLCKTVTGSLSRWPASCWVSLQGKAVGNAFTASRLQAAALIAPAQRPGGRGAAGGGKGRVNFLLCCRCCQAPFAHFFLSFLLFLRAVSQREYLAFPDVYSAHLSRYNIWQASTRFGALLAFLLG